MYSSVNEKMQHGGDPMDVGAVGGWSWYGDVPGDVCGDVTGDVYAVGLKGRGKERAKEKEIVTSVVRPDIFPRLPLSGEG